MHLKLYTIIECNIRVMHLKLYTIIECNIRVMYLKLYTIIECNISRRGSRIQKGGSYIQKGGGFVQEFQERIQVVAGSWANQQANKNCRQP